MTLNVYSAWIHCLCDLGNGYDSHIKDIVVEISYRRKHLGYIPLIKKRKMIFIPLITCFFSWPHLSTGIVFKTASNSWPSILPEVPLINDFFTPSLLAISWRDNWFTCLNCTFYKYLCESCSSHAVALERKESVGVARVTSIHHPTVRAPGSECPFWLPSNSQMQNPSKFIQQLARKMVEQVVISSQLRPISAMFCNIPTKQFPSCLEY